MHYSNTLGGEKHVVLEDDTKLNIEKLITNTSNSYLLLPET